MEELSITPEAARGMVRRGLEELEERIRAHQSAPPGFPAVAAGQQFGDYGRRLAEAYMRLHSVEMRRMQTLLGMLRSTLREIEAIDAANSRHAEDLERIG